MIHLHASRFVGESLPKSSEAFCTECGARLDDPENKIVLLCEACQGGFDIIDNLIQEQEEKFLEIPDEKEDEDENK
jgi:hypothetical protein